MIKHMMMVMKKTVMHIACICVLASLCAVCMRADAASYTGKGSRTDPYLIYTAEQLDGIRDNLTAYYKLANTVDLSGISNFKPIGSLKTPFKGSLSCDLGSDGKPLFAIKNLKINVNPPQSTFADRFKGYKSDGSSGWEAGLFGCADGATFSNIFIFDAAVTNTVEGMLMQNGDFSANPGTDDQAAAILVGIGKNITIKGCGVTGKVTSDSNHVGGMVGNVFSANISQSWSTATVTSTGTWGSGGFIGSAQGTVSISECFYNGTFSGGHTHAGAFAGSVLKSTVKIKDCWSAGVVKTEKSGCFGGTKVHSDTAQEEIVDVSSQCYTRSRYEGNTQLSEWDRLKNANYVSKEPGVREKGFFAATQEKLNEVFKAFPAWTIQAGAYPQLKNVKTAEASAYKPQSGQQPNNTTAAGNTQGSQGGTGPQSSDPQDTQPDGGEGDDTGTTEPGDVSDDGTDLTKSTSDGDADKDDNNADDDLLVMSRRSETLLVVILLILAAAALAGSAVTIILMIKKRPGNR